MDICRAVITYKSIFFGLSSVYSDLLMVNNVDGMFNVFQPIVVHVVDVPPLYRVSQEECTRLREGVLYIKVYRYNPKHLCPKLNSYGDNGQRSLEL